jgi:hypothetical protein
MTNEPALRAALSTLCLNSNSTCSNAAAKALITINTELAAIEVRGSGCSLLDGMLLLLTDSHTAPSTLLGHQSGNRLVCPGHFTPGAICLQPHKQLQ